jgi:hypothetical protein
VISFDILLPLTDNFQMKPLVVDITTDIIEGLQNSLTVVDFIAISATTRTHVTLNRSRVRLECQTRRNCRHATFGGHDWENFGFPLSSNSVIRKLIRQMMCNRDVDSLNDFIPQVRNPLEPFELDETPV